MWQDRLRAQVPRSEIPPFLTDLHELVAALREDRDWLPFLTPLLRAHPDLVLDYLDEGPKRDAVASACRLM